MNRSYFRVPERSGAGAGDPLPPVQAPGLPADGGGQARIVEY